MAKQGYEGREAEGAKEGNWQREESRADGQREVETQRQDR